jgi:hypothetical protein
MSNPALDRDAGRAFFLALWAALDVMMLRVLAAGGSGRERSMPTSLALQSGGRGRT